MRVVKIAGGAFLVLLLTGCSMGESDTSKWIPSETEQVKVTDDKMVEDIETLEESEVVEETAKEKTVNYTLRDIIKNEEIFYCSLSELKESFGTKTKQEETGVHRNTFYMDNNGLLCIGEDVILDLEKNQCIIEKEYCLTDKTVFTEKDILGIEGKWKREKDKLYLDIAILSEIFSWRYQVENNEITVSDDRITLEKNQSAVYEPVVVNVQTGKCWNLAGKQIAAEFAGEDCAGNFTCTGPEDYVEVTEGERFRINYYCSWYPDVASILFLDSEDKVLQVHAYTKSTTFTDYTIVVPTGATKMHFTFYNNQKYKIDRVRLVEGKDLEQLDSQWYQKQCQKILEENQQYSWENTPKKTLDKAYIAFVLDDCRPGMDLVADLFEEYNIPLCIAAISDEFYNPASKGIESRLQVCERVVKNGGEILAHNGQVVTEKSMDDFTTMYEHFYKDKKYLEAYGFPVQGIILAGGKGQIAGSSKTDMWVRTNFDYSDLYGVEEQGEPYYHSRVSMGSEGYRDIIQETIKNKDFVSFYFHGYEEVKEEKVREILDYVSGIPKDKLEPATYKTIYENMHE